MRCPVCSSDTGSKEPLCTHCGSLLTPNRLKERAPKPKLKRGVMLRLIGVVVATAVGAIAGYSLMYVSHSLRDQRHFGALAGAAIGATLVYIVTGLRIIILERTYRKRHRELHAQVSTAVDRAEERYTDALKLGESAQLTKSRLATLHLVKNETQRSVEEFRQAEDSGAHDLAFYNNFGVALARTGNRQRAVQVLEQAAGKDSIKAEPLVNLAHAIAPAELCKDGTLAKDALKHVEKALEVLGESFEVLEREALVLIQDGQYEEAKLELGRAFEKAADRRRQADAKNHLGIDLLLAGNFREAGDEFRSAMSLDPGHARALCNAGVLGILQHRNFFALESLMQARELEPNSAVVVNNLGYAMCLSDAYNEAIKLFRQAISMDAFMWEPFYNLAKMYVDEGFYEYADKYAQRAIELRPQTWEAMVVQGVAKIKQDEHFSAAEILRQAYALAPEEPSVLTNLGIALAFVFEYEEAERLLKTAISEELHDPLPWARLAWMHVMQGIPRLAAEELKVALKIAPKDPIYNNYFGLANLDMGSPDVAILHFKRALTLKPDYGQVHYHLGFVNLVRKNLPEAIKEWQQTTIVEPEFPDGFVNLGVAHYIEGHLDAAVDCFRKALVIRDNRMEDYSNLALTYSKQGQELRKDSKSPSDRRGKLAIDKFKQAIDMFDKALEMEPQNVVLHSNRGLSCWYAERVDEAVQEWSLVSQIDPEYAARRGDLMRSAFDETALSYVPLRISDRMFGFALATADFRYRLAPGYHADRWDLIIEDEDLAPVPDMADEIHYLERNLRGLHV